MAYADYDYYAGTYGGTLIPSVEFTRLSNLASAVIDRITYDRAAAVQDAETIEKIKMATCAVAESIKIVETTGYDAKKSESVGDHSVTYADNAKATRTADEIYYFAARDFLSGTGLLFSGFYFGEYVN